MKRAPQEPNKAVKRHRVSETLSRDGPLLCEGDDLVYLGPTGITITPWPSASAVPESSNSGVSPRRRSRQGARAPRQRRASAPATYKPKSTKQLAGRGRKSMTTGRGFVKSSVTPPPPPTLVLGPAAPKEPTSIESMKAAAQRWFGISTLNNFQMAAVEACFKRQDAFVVVPTGAGKTFSQNDALVLQNSLVVSPLVSLMEDQVLALQEKQIPAMTFSGSRRSVWPHVRQGAYRIVYTSPEFLDMHHEDFKSIASQVLLIAIDECHCVSDWGHNFRPSYRRLTNVRSLFPDVPLMCLTATATQAVCADIVRVFRLAPATTLQLRGSINRPNIFYKIQRRPEMTREALGDLLDLRPASTNFGGGAATATPRRPVDNSSINPYASTVIYVATKDAATNLAEELRGYGVSARAYHAGLSHSERSTVHRLFLADEIQVVCATIAFGMGIDKPDIRRVIHWCLPTSIEAYSQQTGRAGRDRLLSEAVLLWSPKDESRTRNVLLLDAGTMTQAYKEHMLKLFERVVEFVQQENRCRRELLMRYFGETVTLQASENVPNGVCSIAKGTANDSNSVVRCNLCDVCCTENRTGGQDRRGTSPERREPVDFTYGVEGGENRCSSADARLVLSCILACKERTGAGLPCKIAVGSKSKEVLGRRLDKAPCFGKGTHHPIAWWKELLSLLKRRGFIEEKLSGALHRKGAQPQYLAVKLTPKGRSLLTMQQLRFLELHPPEQLLPPPPKKKLDGLDASETSFASSSARERMALRQSLMELRVKEARSRGCAPFMIMPMPLLERLVDTRPSTVDGLLRVIPNLTSETLQHDVLQTIQNAVKGTSLGFDQFANDQEPSPAQFVEVMETRPVNGNVHASNVEASPTSAEDLPPEESTCSLSPQSRSLGKLSPFSLDEFDEVLPPFEPSQGTATETSLENHATATSSTSTGTSSASSSTFDLRPTSEGWIQSLSRRTSATRLQVKIDIDSP